MRTTVTNIGQEAAEGLAIQALGYLAGDPERLGPFLAATGLQPSAIRQAAREPGFLAGVLDHIAADERLLMGFAEDAGCDPTMISRARAALSDEPGHRDTP